MRLVTPNIGPSYLKIRASQLVHGVTDEPVADLRVLRDQRSTIAIDGFIHYRTNFELACPSTDVKFPRVFCSDQRKSFDVIAVRRRIQGAILVEPFARVVAVRMNQWCQDQNNHQRVHGAKSVFHNK